MNHKALALLAALSFFLARPNDTHARDINPVLLSTVPPPPGGTTTDIAASGNFVYVCEGEKGLTILDTSNASSPQLISSIDTPGFASAIALSANLAFIADGTYGLEIIDVSDPAAPRLIGSYDTAGNATAVVVAGNLAYVADGSFGLQIIDVSIPSQPTRLGGYNTFGTALSVALSGNYAYIADADNGLVVIDVSIPANAHRVAGYDRLPATHITISGTYAYVSGPGPLITFDISTPFDPQPISSLDLPGNVTASAISGTTAYVASGPGGFHVLDKTDPYAPRVLGSSSLITNATRVATSDSLAFIADLTNGVRVFAASNPAVMRVVAHLPVAGPISDLAVSGDYLYVVAQGQSFTYFMQVVNISQLDDMHVNGGLTGTNFTSSGGTRIVLFDKYAAVFGSYGDIISIADPATPAYVRSDRFGARDAKGFGPYLILGGSGLKVDVMSDSGLQTVGAFARTTIGNQTVDISVYSVAAKGTNVWAFAFAIPTNTAPQFECMLQIDISNPSNPTLTRSLRTDYFASEMDVSSTNGFAFGGAGLLAFDLNSLAQIATTSIDRNSKRFVAATNLIYLAKGIRGIEVLRFDGAAFASLGGAGLPDATAIAVTTNYVFVGAGTNGLYVLTHYQPTARLEASINTNRTPQLSVFAPIGSAGRIQRASTLTTNSFQDWQSVQLNSYPQVFTDTNSRSAFYRFVSP